MCDQIKVTNKARPPKAKVKMKPGAAPKPPVRPKGKASKGK